MHKQPSFTPQDAANAKNKNIIEIALGFSAMTRVFAKQSDKNTGAARTILHSAFCKWFIENICTAEKKFRNGRIAASCQCSYGHAAKVLDVAAKVYIYYCAQPSLEAAQRLVPMLHAALDTDMMHNLCRRSPASLYGVDRAEYERLQTLVFEAIRGSGIYPVQYDDLMWRRLQRHVP